jgi:beta-glucosidase
MCARQAYSCVIHVLEAHAAAVREFRSIVPDGRISINLNCDWGEPYTSSQQDKVRPPLSAPPNSKLLP